MKSLLYSTIKYWIFPCLFCCHLIFKEHLNSSSQNICGIFSKTCIYHHGWENIWNLWLSDRSKIHFPKMKSRNLYYYLLSQVLLKFLTPPPRKRKSKIHFFCPSRKRGHMVSVIEFKCGKPQKIHFKINWHQRRLGYL